MEEARGLVSAARAGAKERHGPLLRPMGGGGGTAAAPAWSRPPLCHRGRLILGGTRSPLCRPLLVVPSTVCIDPGSHGRFGAPPVCPLASPGLTAPRFFTFFLPIIPLTSRRLHLTCPSHPDLLRVLTPQRSENLPKISLNPFLRDSLPMRPFFP